MAMIGTSSTTAA